MEKNIHAGHRSRLLEQALKDELDGFYPHQVLELLLFYAIPRQDTSAVAHRLIDAFGTVRGALEAPVEELVRIQGVGARAAGWLKREDALTKSYAALNQSDRPSVATAMDAVRFCIEREESLNPPVSMQLNLTPTGRIQSFTKIADSEDWTSPVNLRMALNEALSLHAKSVSVVVYPAMPVLSDLDRHREQAVRVHRILKAMDITLMDVLLLHAGDATSLRRLRAFEGEEDPRIARALNERYFKENNDG